VCSHAVQSLLMVAAGCVLPLQLMPEEAHFLWTRGIIDLYDLNSSAHTASAQAAAALVGDTVDPALHAAARAETFLAQLDHWVEHHARSREHHKKKEEEFAAARARRAIGTNNAAATATASASAAITAADAKNGGSGGGGGGGGGARGVKRKADEIEVRGEGGAGAGADGVSGPPPKVSKITQFGNW
jgi:hypothetical protein